MNKSSQPNPGCWLMEHRVPLLVIDV